MYCADCEQINRYFFEKTTFWLFFPTTESTTKAKSICASSDFQYEQHNSHCVSIRLDKHKIKSFFMSFYGDFEPPELANTKVTTTTGNEPNIEDIARVIPLSVLINRYNSQWVVESLESNNYETHFQPIVEVCNTDASQTRPFAYEGLFRMKDEQNNIVPPAHVFSLAKDSDLLFSLDLAARRSAVSHYAKAQLQGKLFINFNPTSIYDPSYCLRATVSAIDALGIPPENIVFEITETHRIENESVLRGILNFYRNAGFQVALDDIGSGWSGLNMLHKFQPDYVKVDMDLVRNLHQDQYKQTIVKHLIKIAHNTGIKVIAEGIENEQELNMLIEFEADYLQGFYFAKPKMFEPKVDITEQQHIDKALGSIPGRAQDL